MCDSRQIAAQPGLDAFNIQCCRHRQLHIVGCSCRNYNHRRFLSLALQQAEQLCERMRPRLGGDDHRQAHVRCGVQTFQCRVHVMNR